MPTSKSTSPAFQFYPKDWFSSSKVSRMSFTERGIYITLLAYCWLDGGLPDDISALAKLLGIRQPQFARMWAGPLSECFVAKNGHLHNERLNEERRKQAEFRRRQSDNGRLGGRPKKAVGFSGLTQNEPEKSSSSSSSSSSSFSSSKEKRKEGSPEPLRDSTPTVLAFAVVGDVNAPTWALTQGRINGWLAAYPNVDVLGECRKAAAWVDANPDRRKTAKGMPAFLVRWLGKAADNGRSATHAGATAKTAGNIAALQSFINRGKTA